MRDEQLNLLRQLAGPKPKKKSLVQRLREYEANKLAPPPEGLGALLLNPLGDDDDE